MWLDGCCVLLFCIIVGYFFVVCLMLFGYLCSCLLFVYFCWLDYCALVLVCDSFFAFGWVTMVVVCLYLSVVLVGVLFSCFCCFSVDVVLFDLFYVLCFVC